MIENRALVSERLRFGPNDCASLSKSESWNVCIFRGGRRDIQGYQKRYSGVTIKIFRSGRRDIQR